VRIAIEKFTLTKVEELTKATEKWDIQDSNLGPRNYAHHFDFRRQISLFVVRTMPSPLSSPTLGGLLWPLHVPLRASLGVGSPSRAGRSPNLNLTNHPFPNGRPIFTVLTVAQFLALTAVLMSHFSVAFFSSHLHLFAKAKNVGAHRPTKMPKRSP
jgi:hypothetical protein